MEKYKVIYRDGVKEYLSSCEEIISHYDELIIFGASKTGESVFSFLKGIGVVEKVKMVVDNDEKKHNMRFHSFCIKSRMVMEEYLKNNDALVIIASGSAHIIMRQLTEEGVSAEKMISFPFGFLQLKPSPYEFLVKNKDKIDYICGKLNDEKSKVVFTALLNFKMSRELSLLKNIADEENQQYFGDGFFSLDKDEHILDCGAYIGDTLDNFCSQNVIWGKYYCIEADPDVFERLKKHAEEIKAPNTEFFLFGCWDADGLVPFESLNSEVSRIVDDESAAKIVSRKLDSVFAGKKITFIKMDIEGAELKAIQGGLDVISVQRPIMAISIYHSLNDFIDIPLFLMNELSDYKYYIRHYRCLSDSETVFYAIPEERNNEYINSNIKS